MKRLLLSWLSAELLETIGLWLIIGGLIGEAALVFSWLETEFEKPLTFAFTVAIALGVWLENVGASDISSEKDARIAEANARALEAQLALEKFKAPRQINGEDFLRRLEGKPKAPVEILFVRDDAECWQLAMQMRDWLRAAKWEYSEPAAITGPDEARFASYPSSMQAGGQPNGVAIVQRVTSQADFKREEGSLFDGPIDTPHKALAYALIGSLGGINGHLSFETGPTPGTLRVVVGPKP